MPKFRARITYAPNTAEMKTVNDRVVTSRDVSDVRVTYSICDLFQIILTLPKTMLTTSCFALRLAMSRIYHITT